MESLITDFDVDAEIRTDVERRIAQVFAATLNPDVAAVRRATKPVAMSGEGFAA